MKEVSQDTDFLLLACDGLFEEFTNQEVFDFVMQRFETKSATEIAQELGA
jgi:serine/threonine protein phosphatase PrpC